MEFKVYSDRKNIKCGVTIELPEAYFVLECFLFEANPARYVKLLTSLADGQGFNTEKSGVRFQSELDWEDEANGIFLNESQIYLFNHEFGDLVMGIADFFEVVCAFFNTYLEVQTGNSSLDSNVQSEIKVQLERLGGMTSNKHQG